jgi:ribosomal protein L11 methyltransferase
MDWVELILPAGELVDEVAALMASSDPLAAAGVEVRADEIVVWVPAAEGRAGEQALRLAAERLRAAGLPVDPQAVRMGRVIGEDEWRDVWKRWFKTTRLGRRLVIVPSWDTHTARPEDVVLELDPGRAFGTGAHASTRLCLLELERRADEGGQLRRFLDVGTGSGILAIAAARLWPGAKGVAIDVDPEAIDAARENLERNQVLDRVELRVSESPSGEHHDLVLANIQADVLERMRDALAAALAPQGRLILSGILTPQADEIIRCFAAVGLVQARTSTLAEDPDWTAVVLAR